MADSQPRAVVVDASVIVSAVSPEEGHHEDALTLLRKVHQRRLPLEEPAHFLLELYAVLNRRPRELRALGFMTEKNAVEFTLHPIDAEQVQAALAWLSADSPGRCPTRGADLAYAWVARSTGLPLVTLDKGLQGFGEVGLAVYSPREALEVLGASRA